MRLPTPQKLLFALLPLMMGGSLSAFEIPVQLPSGATIHLNTEPVHINEFGDLVWINTVLNPEEERLFAEDPSLWYRVGRSLQRTWRYHDCPNMWRCDNCFTYPYILLPAYVDNINRLMLLCNVDILGIDSVENPSISSAETIEFREAFQDTFFKTSNLAQEVKDSFQELEFGLKPDKIHEEPPGLSMLFSKPSSDIGGKWRLAPYELLLIRNLNSEGSVTSFL